MNNDWIENKGRKEVEDQLYGKLKIFFQYFNFLILKNYHLKKELKEMGLLLTKGDNLKDELIN